MKKEIADKIYDKVFKEWVKRHGEENLNKQLLENLHSFLQSCPDKDGLKRVTSMETGKTHLVPYEEIMLNGLKGNELNKYPTEEN